MVKRTYYPNGQSYIVEDRVNGRRVNKVVIYDATGQEINNLRYVNDQICHISYRKNNTLHNEHGPAHMHWYDNDEICHISYRKNNTLHNEHGITYVYCNSTSEFQHIHVYHFGKLIKEITY